MYLVRARQRHGVTRNDEKFILLYGNHIDIVMKKHICYLCGKPIDEKVSKDHVPPRQFFTKGFRKLRSPQLLTLPSHSDCNKSYQADEDYFFAALAGLNEEAQIHEWLIDDVRTKISKVEARGLRQTVLSEFSEIALPNDLVAKHFNPKRANRIVWKIIRGLCFHHYSRILPENVKHKIMYWQVQDKPPKIYQENFMNRRVYGAYPEVFFYLFRKVSDKDSLSALWALFFWESLVAIVPVVASQFQDDNIS